MGSLCLASIRDLKRTGLLLIASVLVWHATMIGFAVSRDFMTSFGILLLSGMAFSASIALIVTVMFKVALPEYRGRIMGVRVLAISAHTLGSVNTGWITGLLGAPITAVINGVSGIVLALLLTLIAPKFRRA